MCQKSNPPGRVQAAPGEETTLRAAGQDPSSTAHEAGQRTPSELLVAELRRRRWKHRVGARRGDAFSVWSMDRAGIEP